MKSSKNRNALALLLALNALGLVALYWLRTNQLLKIVLDLDAADAPHMRAALHAYVTYGAAVLFLVLLGFYDVMETLGVRAARVALIVSVLCITAATIFFYVDTIVFRDYGIHAYDFDIARVFVDAAAARDLGVRKRDLAMAVFACSAIAALQGAVMLAGRRLSGDSENVSRWMARGAFAILLIAGGIFLWRQRHVTSDPGEFAELLPAHGLLLAGSPRRPAIPVKVKLGDGGYPSLASAPAPHIADRRNIIFFVSDAMRADLAAPNTGLAPNMNRFGARADVINPLHHYSTGHVTEMGSFGLLYSLNGYNFNAFVGERVPSYPLSVLRANGYTTAMIAGSPIPPYPSDYLTQMWDTVLRPANDEDALRMVNEYVAERRKDGKPYFLFAFLYMPHWPFDLVQPRNRRFHPTLDSVHRAPFSEMEDSAFRVATRNSMKNAIIQADDNFARFFAFVKTDFESGRTAIVVTSDHGTEAWERGVFGHGRSVFWNEKFRVPMMMGLPGVRLAADVRRPALGSHADIWPTLLDYLGAKTSTRFADGVSWLTTPAAAIARRRDVVLTGRYFPYAARPNAMVFPEGKVWFRAYEDGQLRTRAFRYTTIDDKDLPVRNAPPVAEFNAYFTRFLRIDQR